MLDQELLTLPFRVDLLEAQRDQLARTVERVTARIELLEDLSSQQRRAEANAAEVAAEAAVDEATGKHALIQQLAEQNAELTRDISASAIDLKKSGDSDESVERDAKRIEDDFRAAREQLEVAGISVVLGEALRRQRQSLPAPCTAAQDTGATRGQIMPASCCRCCSMTRSPGVFAIRRSLLLNCTSELTSEQAVEHP